MHTNEVLKVLSSIPTVVCVVLYVTQFGHVVLIFNLIMNKI